MTKLEETMRLLRREVDFCSNYSLGNIRPVIVQDAIDVLNELISEEKRLASIEEKHAAERAEILRKVSKPLTKSELKMLAACAKEQPMASELPERLYTEAEMKESFEAGFRSSGEEFNGETGYSMYRMGTFADFLKELNTSKL